MRPTAPPKVSRRCCWACITAHLPLPILLSFLPSMDMGLWALPKSSLLSKPSPREPNWQPPSTDGYSTERLWPGPSRALLNNQSVLWRGHCIHSWKKTRTGHNENSGAPDRARAKTGVRTPGFCLLMLSNRGHHVLTYCSFFLLPLRNH